MSWWQLVSALKPERQRPIVACPNDGEPLLQGPDKMLYCPFDGYRPGQQKQQ